MAKPAPAPLERMITTLRGLYDAYGRKDPSVFFGLLSRDVRFRIAAPRAQFRFAESNRNVGSSTRAGESESRRVWVKVDEVRAGERPN